MNSKFDTVFTVILIIVLLLAVGYIFLPRKQYEKEYDELSNDFSTLSLYFDHDEDITFEEAKESFHNIESYLSK